MIECEHVYKQYKNGTNALYDVNFSVKQGEFVYIIGPTGSGKSTLIKLLDGEELPTKGNVEVVGINVGLIRKCIVGTNAVFLDSQTDIFRFRFRLPS